MGVEIERKFLVQVEKLPKPLPQGDELEQGYLSTDPAVRVRLVERPDGMRSAALTIKGRGLLKREEFEYGIPPEDAEQLLKLCTKSLHKVRRELGAFVLDHFADRGLWLAEIELASEDAPFEKPDWLGREVTGDPAYANTRLARNVAGPSARDDQDTLAPANPPAWLANGQKGH
jgi:adenylate cyclase